MTQTVPTPSPEDLERINSETRFAFFSVFRALDLGAEIVDRGSLAAEVNAGLAELEAEGLVTRGWYDVAGLRADADLMVWWHAPTVEVLQRAYRALLKTTVGALLEPVWSVCAVHRPAEFNRRHVPAFLAGEAAGDYLCVYPFVRSYDWYLLPEAERSTMLRDHGLAARSYGDVRANTLASFALGDYEFILAFEAQELVRIVDLMRDLRATEARRHVREEVPFYTGPRVQLEDWIAERP
ncbi:chlorite dismutase family protein [Micrococcales bacterium 31B]|nr:chlorite dismutase family protein [Micrococcales bacterium 31B]